MAAQTTSSFQGPGSHDSGGGSKDPSENPRSPRRSERNGNSTSETNGGAVPRVVPLVEIVR